jgi:GDP-4-dehydro-6-deoxy-D-mannose reductase
MELIDPFSVKDVINKVEPDTVFHMAGQSYVPTSWTSPINTFQTNAIGTMNVLEAVREYNPDILTMISGSSEEYGKVYKEECPIKETQPLRPLSPYGVSKVAADMLGYQYAQSYDMNIIVTRAFNMTGPRRGEMFVDSNFAKQIVDMEKNHSDSKQHVLKRGNGSAIRDFTDVRDTVRAFWMLSNKVKHWDGTAINICSGQPHTITDVIYELITRSTISGYISVEEDPARMRPSDVPMLIGDNTLLKGYIHWQPQYTWERSLGDLLDYWRIRI